MTTVSVIIKALNEEEKIACAVESALAAVSRLGGEVILADSLSTDRTVEIAGRYPIRIIQLINAVDRSCGVGAQLGYTVANGEFIYILDGDMELQDGFLEVAVEEMRADPSLAGVGGRHEEVCLDNLEFQARKARAPANMHPGFVDRLDCGGLYRRSAIEAVGYLTNRYLHSYEELDLAVRLRHAGYRLKRINVHAVKHSGHTENSFRLLVRRWRSKYIFGVGEVLRAAWRTPRFSLLLGDLKELRVYSLTFIWWLASVALWTACFFDEIPVWMPVVTSLAPFLLMALKRRSVSGGVYAVTSWSVHLVALVVGFTKGSGNPAERVAANVLQD